MISTPEPLQPDNDVMTVWTDCKRGKGALNSCESGKPKAFSTPGRSYAVALPFICCGQFAGRLSPSVIKFGVIFFTQ
ncbi:Uncharacterised protein [Salmonella enterica]|nr:Uncharacterised protein [Salmonella enterica]